MKNQTTLLFHTEPHSDGRLPITRIVRRADEPNLIEMERDEKTGITRFTYEFGVYECGSRSRSEKTPGGLPVTWTQERNEERPSHRGHTGWQMFNGRFTR